MSDLPKAGREELVGTLVPELATEVRRATADAGRTIKTLYRMHDGALIETVLMAYPDRVTLCLSCQAGCGMGCPFCATGKLGLTRNLSTAEMLEQVRYAAAWTQEGKLGRPARLSNVVFMGMGEPMANYRSVLAAVRAITAASPEGFGISARSITVSTCGLIPGMDRLATEGLALRLAVSLHAPDDSLRDRLVPVNRRYPVGQVLDAARRYYSATGRRVSIEYALIRDVNDQPWRAEALARELRRRGSGWVHVNPIGLNPVPGSPWQASRPADQAGFVRILEEWGVATTIRDTRGAKIDAACGQLAAEGSRDNG
jgi:23S rRNA (adenine2503-C2)-methyltransferase